MPLRSAAARGKAPYNVMTAYVLRRADHSDLPAVMDLLGEAARWLARRRIDQWPAEGFPQSRIAKSVARSHVYLLTTDHGIPAATVTVDSMADPEFWRPDDDPHSALYVHKLATGRIFSGQGLGRLLLDWAGDLAVTSDRRWLRLDCAKENPALQAFYRGSGFEHIRTIDLPHRSSGALFQRPASRRTFTGGAALHDGTDHDRRDCRICGTETMVRQAG